MFCWSFISIRGAISWTKVPWQIPWEYRFLFSLRLRHLRHACIILFHLLGAVFFGYRIQMIHEAKKDSFLETASAALLSLTCSVFLGPVIFCYTLWPLSYGRYDHWCELSLVFTEKVISSFQITLSRLIETKTDPETR